VANTASTKKPPLAEPASMEPPSLEWGQRLRDVLDVGGLWIRDTKAPTYAQLRPFMTDPTTEGFPVYKDLATRMLEAEQPDETVRHVLATCSGYAYSGAETVSTIMARMGLANNHCRMVASSTDAMFISSTAYLVQSECGRVVILCYRGTEPLNFISWLTDGDVDPERIGYQFGNPCSTVHAGFYRNVRATRYQVMSGLERAWHGRSVRTPLMEDLEPDLSRVEALYLAGHSLGGAMAALMAVMLRHETKYAEIASVLRGVYTFGQPMVGDHRFAEACQQDDFLREKVLRYVYDSDVVPHLPPATSGAFRHFGREFRYRIPHHRNTAAGLLRMLGAPAEPVRGRWEEPARPTGQMLSGIGLALGASAFVANKFQLARLLPTVYSFEDHLPHHYIAAVTPYGVKNEFGD
jgi:hypothetical protein